MAVVVVLLRACVRACLCACECVKRRLRGCTGEWRRGWRSGWLFESQMDYQLIRMNRLSGVVVEEEEVVEERGERYRGEKVQRRRRGEIFSGCPVPCCAPRCLYQSRTGNGSSGSNIPESSIFHAQMRNGLCIIPVEEQSLHSFQMMLRQARLLTHTHTQTHTRAQTHTHTRLSAAVLASHTD